MNVFVPSGCVTCFAALNEIYGGTTAPNESYWSLAFSDYNARRRVRLDDRRTERLKKTIFELQRLLFEGERIACYAGKNGLVDLSANEFAGESGTNAIARARIFPNRWHPTSGGAALLIRTVSDNAQHLQNVSLKVGDIQKHQHEKPVGKAASAYLVRNSRGPGTHYGQWVVALSAVNDDLTQQGESPVSLDTLKRQLGLKK
jgi:hypothetical protein